MEVACTSMIHAAAPHFLWPFVVRYAAHQLNLRPRVSLPETSPTLRWTGKVGDASVFQVWGSRAFVRDTSSDKLSARAIPCIFLGCVPDAPGWQFYHPTSRRILPSQDVTFDESVPFYHLFPYRSAPSPPPSIFLAPDPPPVDPLPPLGPAPSGVSQVDPLPGTAPVQVAFVSGAAPGAASGGAASGGAKPGGAGSEGARSGGAEPEGVEPRGAESEGAEPEGAKTEGVESGGAEPQGAASSGGPTGASPRLSSQQLLVGVGGTGAIVAGVGGPGGGGAGAAGAGAVDPGAGGTGGNVRPHLYLQLSPEGDPDAPDIPTPRSYVEAIKGPYSSQWAKWPPGSPPAFKARYAALGFSQGQGVDYFQTFSPTPKMTTLRVMLHVAAQRDYELHSLDFSTALLQGSLHEEIWPRGPPDFTGLIPIGTQRSLRQPVYGLRQAPREWHDTLRTTLAALGFVPSTANPSLFLRTDTSLPPFYVLVYVDDLVFATADTEALTLVKSELQKRHTCTDLGELRSYLGLQITRDRGQRTITLTQSHMVHQVVQRFDFQYSLPQLTPLSTSHSLSAPPSDKSVEPNGPYPERVGCLMYLITCTRPDLAYPLSLLARYVALGRHRKVQWDVAKRVLRYLCSKSGMGLVLGGRGPVVLTGHADASWEYRLEHRTKHIALRYFLARELQQRGQLHLAYVATQANTADVFTKALLPGDHQRFVTVLVLLALLCLTGLHLRLWGLLLLLLTRRWSDTTLPPFYVLVYVDDLVFATADTEALTLVMSEQQKRHTCTDLGEVLQRFGFQFSSPQPTPLATGHSLSAPPSDESVEPTGPYPELVGCLIYLMTCTQPDHAYPLSLLARYVAPSRHRKVHRDAAKRVLYYLCSTSGMGLVLGGRGPVVLTGHADPSWVDDSATQRSSQGYTFSLGSGSVSWRSTRSSSVLISSCEAEIYAGAMAAQELCWLTYLLTDLGEKPHSPPVVYVDNKAMIALCQEHSLEHRMNHIAL
ncbi:unnamed protein product [Closterium sp. NIES-53]